MKHKDIEFSTVDKIGILGYEDDELMLFVELKNISKKYKVEDLLKRMVGTTVQFKSITDEE